MSNEKAAPDASILLSFRGRNVRSFRDEFELSLLATRLAEKEVVRNVVWREGGSPIGVLPVACVFGANASGKTNVLRAMDDMRGHVRSSFRKGSPAGRIPRAAFLLDPEAAKAASLFEVDLVLDGVRHTYGFELDDLRVLKEWAYRYPKGRPQLVFTREGMELTHGARDRARGRAVEKLLRPNALFLSTAAATDLPSVSRLFAWFDSNLLFADAGTRAYRQQITASLLEDDESSEIARTLLRAADIGISGVTRREWEPAEKEKMQRLVRVFWGELVDETSGEASEPPDLASMEMPISLVHDGAQGGVELELSQESLGTLVWFGLIGPVVAALRHGSVLLADELDASLHPALVSELVRLFQDPATNPRRAQLIFNSHDVGLLGDSAGDRLLGRDQIWFAEKLAAGDSRLYTLSELDPRKEESLGRRYLAGRYGATPILSREEFREVAGRIAASSSAAQ